jgi:hypothetical protein
MAGMVAVLFSLLPGHGHVNPLRPLADAFTKAGCEVRLAGSPPFTQILRHAGYSTLNVGPEWTLAEDFRVTRQRFPAATTRELWSEIFSNRSVEALTAMMNGNLAGAADIVIHDDHDFAGALFGELNGSYRVCVATTFRSPIETQRARWHDLWSSLRMRAGLEPDPGMAAFWGHICIDALPPPFQPNPLSSRRSQDLFMNPILSDVAGEFSRVAARPRGVCRKVGITFGTVYPSIVPHLHNAEAALAKDGFAVAWLNRADGSTLPRSAYVNWLRDQDVIICHGGAGTVLDCLALGIPVVCWPMGADQAYNSFRVASLGAGFDLGQEPDVESAAVEAVRQIRADDLYRRNAWRLSCEMRTLPSVDECVTTILRARERAM